MSNVYATNARCAEQPRSSPGRERPRADHRPPSIAWATVLSRGRDLEPLVGRRAPRSRRRMPRQMLRLKVESEHHIPCDHYISRWSKDSTRIPSGSSCTCIAIPWFSRNVRSSGGWAPSQQACRLNWYSDGIIYSQYFKD